MAGIELFCFQPEVAKASSTTDPSPKLWHWHLVPQEPKQPKPDTGLSDPQGQGTRSLTKLTLGSSSVLFCLVVPKDKEQNQTRPDQCLAAHSSSEEAGDGEVLTEGFTRVCGS